VKVGAHPLQHSVEPPRAGVLACPPADLGELAKRLVRERDRPGADHARPHGWIGRLKGITPVAVLVVDQRRAPQKTRLTLSEHPVAVRPQGFVGGHRLEPLVLRRVLGPVRLVPVVPEVGRSYYQAETALQVLDLVESPEGGSNWLRWWRRALPVRTVAQSPLVFPLTETRQPFRYQQLGKVVSRLVWK
jgi:hypothetical protein